MDQSIIIVATIAVLALVQSIFGMGLLVFGTPSLLLLGLPFSEALGWLLPASVAISAIQVGSDSAQTVKVWKGARPLLCLIPLVITLGLVLRYNLHAKIDIAIGVTLLAASIVRMNKDLQNYLAKFVKSGEQGYLVIMGLVHGFTNMGGALLSVYASSQHGEKHDIRGTISAYYLSFGIVQILTLAIFKPGVLALHGLLAAAVSASIYLAAGQFAFKHSTPRLYNNAFTGFIAFYGVAVVLKTVIQAEF